MNGTPQEPPLQPGEETRRTTTETRRTRPPSDDQPNVSGALGKILLCILGVAVIGSLSIWLGHKTWNHFHQPADNKTAENKVKDKTPSAPAPTQEDLLAAMLLELRQHNASFTILKDLAVNSETSLAQIAATIGQQPLSDTGGPNPPIDLSTPVPPVKGIAVHPVMKTKVTDRTIAEEALAMAKENKRGIEEVKRIANHPMIMFIKKAHPDWTNEQISQAMADGNWKYEDEAINELRNKREVQAIVDEQLKLLPPPEDPPASTAPLQ